MNTLEIKKQRAEVSRLVYGLTGKKLAKLDSGRPFIGKSEDISVSHKDDIVSVGIVPSPYRIGIDVERIDVLMNERLFLNFAITDSERIVLEKFCKSNQLPVSSGIAVFWSIKESFFKCLDYDLKPQKIGISGISKNGEVRIRFSDEIKKIMTVRKFRIFSAEAYLAGEYVFSRVVMKGD